MEISGAPVGTTPRGGLRSFGLIARELTREIEDRAAALGRVDARIGFEKIGRTRLGQECYLLRQRTRRFGLVEIADEIDDAAFQRFADLDQARKANAVGAVFIFLNLLKGNPDSTCKLILRKPKLLAAQTDTRSE